MESLMDNLSQIVLTHQAWSYYIIALGTILQGEITLLVAMYLILDGSLGFGKVLLSSFLAVFITDYFLYFLGNRLRHTKFGWRFYKRIKNDRKTQLYSYYISQNLRKVIILSKFLIGTNILTLVIIGWTRVKFRKFFKAHLESLLIWLLTMIFISYSLASGAYALKAGKIFKRAEIIIFVVFVLLILGELLLKRFVNKIINIETKAKDIGDNFILKPLKIFKKDLEKLEDKKDEENLKEDELNDEIERKDENRVKSDNLENIFKKE
jgi:membrane protein DedA with SNARE-associated domain